VETSAVLARLVDLGCDAVQGYLLGRPSPAAVVRSTIDASTIAAAA
jgi:EAL domain-containing protein (putative c-di-GMP-specific phosphodiesterase class I)